MHDLPNEPEANVVINIVPNDRRALPRRLDVAGGRVERRNDVRKVQRIVQQEGEPVADGEDVHDDKVEAGQVVRRPVVRGDVRVTCEAVGWRRFDAESSVYLFLISVIIYMIHSEEKLMDLFCFIMGLSSELN